ncbi:MAG: hypothetical protein EHM81_06705, partial [Chloroflexi bacterium]
IPQAIQQSLEGVEHVAHIVGAMKEFAHPDAGRKQAVDLNHAIEGAITLCCNEWKYVAEVVADFAPDLPEFVENVIIKTLAKSPDDRYANMGEVVVAFERLLAEATLTLTRMAEKLPVPPAAETVETEKPAPATLPHTPEPVSAPAEAPKTVETKPRRSLLLPAVIGVVFLAILALGGWAASQYLPAVFASPTATLNVSSLPGRVAEVCGPGNNEICVSNEGREILKSIKLPLPEEFGQIDDLAWSPDGQRLVLAVWRTKTGKTENDLYVFSLASNNLSRLTNGENNVQPAWSPDGQWIAYHSSGWAMITSPDGGNQQRVSRGYDNRFMAAVPAWSPDSEWLAWLALEQSQSQALKGLMVYSLRKQEVTFIPFAPSEPPDFNYELYWEPHGRYVYIWSPHYQQARRFDLACLQKSCADLEPETEDEEIPREWSKHYYPQWRIAHPGQVAVNWDNLPAPSLPSAPTQLPPNPAWLATAKPGRSAAPCLDNERELCIRNENEFVLERIKLTKDDGQPLSQISENGVWSPEGNRVVLSIQDGQDNKHNLYLYDFSNRSLARLTNQHNNLYPAWSPDEIWIYFHSNCEARLIKPNGSGLTKLGANEHPRGYCSTFASWSPDSHLLGRLLQSEDGDTSLRAVAIDNLKNNTTTIIPWSQSIGQNVDGFEIAWTPDGAAVLVQVRNKSEKQVYRLNIACLQTGCAEKDWQPVDFSIPETWLNYFYPRWGKDAPPQTGQKSVKIALQAPLSGNQAPAGVDIQRAAQLAFEQLSGPLKELGFRLDFVPFDDQANPEIGVQNAKKIVADEAFLCGVGHFNSGVTIPASAIYHPAGIPFVSPTNTGPGVTEAGYLEINRVVGRDDIQGKVGAQFAQKQGYKSLLVIHENSGYGRGLAQIFSEEAKRLGMNITGSLVANTPKDFETVAAEIASKKPDLAFFAGTFNIAGPLFRQIRAAGYGGTLMGGDGIDSPDLVKLGGPALLKGGGVVYTSILVNPRVYPEAAGFIKDFQAKYNAYPQPFAAPAYDAMGICLKAIENAARAKNGELTTRKE